MEFIAYLKKYFLSKDDVYPITLYPKIKPKGRVLFSYLADPLLWKNSDYRFLGHSNNWESKIIANIFLELGFIIDAINYYNTYFYPDKNYDVIFDIHYNLQRLMPFLNKDIIKILHITGSYPRFSVNAELKRVKNLEKRRDCFYSPKRIIDLELFDRSLIFADCCSLLGNNFVLNTFPEKYHKKITKLTVSASKLSYVKKQNYVPKEKEFIWFFGGGAVHKGLDLVLDFFVNNKNLVLNVVGNISSERDFCKIYKKELTTFSNIRYHGYIHPSSKEFIDIIKRCFCFVAPSCSEGISPAVATLMQTGLFPIVSRNTGIDLPGGCGIYLDDLSVTSIKKAVEQVDHLNEFELIKQIQVCQRMALNNYSRDDFYRAMKTFLYRSLFGKK